MNIMEMTRKQFEELDYFEEFEEFDVDSIVFLPTKKHDQSGFNVFYVVACNKWEPVAKCCGYDVFDIFMGRKYSSVVIDCLRGSGLMRVLLPTDEYVIKPWLHQIVKKEK